MVSSDSDNKELESKSSGLLSVPAAFIKKLYANGESMAENQESNVTETMPESESELESYEADIDDRDEDVRDMSKSLVNMINATQSIFYNSDAFGSVKNMASQITDLSEANDVLFSIVNVVKKVSNKYVIEQQDNVFGLPLEIIKKFKFSKNYHDKSKLLRKKCENIRSVADLNSSLQGIYELFYIVYQDTYSDKEELENFLFNIGAQISRIGDKLHNVAEEQASDIKLQGELNERMSNTVTLINNNISSENDLVSLKNIVKVQLDALQEIVEEERQVVKVQETRVNENVKVLVNQVNELKKEAQELRDRVQLEKEHALHDPLTGLYNRQAYNEKISEVISTIESYDNFSLLIWDIDHFKKFNDQYGHVVGDKVLKTVSEKLSKLLKKDYFLARFGGEEFAMLVPDLTVELSKEFADHIRIEVSNTVFMVKGKQVKITVSCGISNIHHKDTAQSIFERADKALYAAKEDGRNRVNIYVAE
ncbi:MAG: GGDEF domain-containing protein [Gammaproteobacteria bacterium]